MVDTTQHISEVFNEDCMVGMARYPDKWFDLAVVDPPYGIKIASNGNLHNNSKYDRGFKKNKEYKPVLWDNKAPTKEYFEELKRISRCQIIWGGNFFFDYLGSQRSYIIWSKKGNDTNPNFSPVEFAWTNCNGLPKLYEIDWIGFGYINSGETKIHPTQKPVKLYESIYQDYLPQGGKVIDTHLGSGSNRIAANKAGNIDFVGFELDKDYYEAQEKRWKGFIAQTRLF